MYLIDENENQENMLNCEISFDEIEKAMKNLKTNKSCGIDKILNEHIKLFIYETCILQIIQFDFRYGYFSKVMDLWHYTPYIQK